MNTYLLRETADDKMWWIDVQVMTAAEAAKANRKLEAMGESTQWVLAPEFAHLASNEPAAQAA